MGALRIKSRVFDVERINLAKTIEDIVRGGRDKLHLLPQALRGIKQIGVIGFKSQGMAQALNLRESLEGTGIKVKVGLRRRSSSRKVANKHGFTTKSGTLGAVDEVIKESDLVILLIQDSAQVKNFEKFFDLMKPGATLGLSHGFLLGHMQNIGAKFPSHINVIGVCPKGMGPSVRRLYELGKDGNGAGINCSIAVEQDIDGRATDIALAWAIAIGAPWVFITTLINEVRSDLVGERGVLLGGVWGMLEALFKYFNHEGGADRITSFLRSVECVTGTLRKKLSAGGLLGVYNSFGEADRGVFVSTYNRAYWPYYNYLVKIYSDVASGDEIKTVIRDSQRLKTAPMTMIGTHWMWTETGPQARKLGRDSYEYIDPVTAGLYLAMIMAQVDVLRERKHCWSEICNESIIEALDSLLAYMHLAGIEHMVDNCSTAARLGTRAHGPIFELITRAILVGMTKLDQNCIKHFLKHPVHGALEVCFSMRPPVELVLAA